MALSLGGPKCIGSLRVFTRGKLPYRPLSSCVKGTRVLSISAESNLT